MGFDIRYPSADESAANEAMLEHARWKGREHLRELGRAEAEMLWRDLRRGAIRRVEGIHVPLAIARQLDSLDRLQNVEFRSANIPLNGVGGRFSKAEWRDCQFVDVVVDDWRNAKAIVAGCLFDRFDSGRAYTGFAHDTLFEDCEFRESRFRETRFQRVTIRRTRFVNLRGERVHFDDCSFDTVSATGGLQTPHLLRCDFRATDFSGLHLVEATLMETRGPDLLLPAYDDSFAVPADRFVAAFRAELPRMSERSREGAAALEHEDLLDKLFLAAGNGETFWRPELIADLFDIELADAARVAERLVPHRLFRLA